MKISALLLPLLAIALAAAQPTAETDLTARQLTGTHRAMDDPVLPGAPYHIFRISMQVLTVEQNRKRSTGASRKR